MSILLVRPGNFDPYKFNFMKYFSFKYPPMNLAILAAQIEDPKIIDLSIKKDPKRSLIKTLGNGDFDFVGINVITPLMEETKSIISIIRKHSNAKVILGGPHVTALPEETLFETGADIICIGEGDNTLREITEDKDVRKIRGVGYFAKGKVRINAPRGLINLDELKLPRWDLLRKDKYFTLFSKRNPTGIIETSRGCPYNCIYCHKQTFGRTYRVKSPKKVVDEMEHALNSGFREIHLVDDAFSVHRKRVIEICKEIRKRRLDVPWALPCGLRVDQADSELFDDLHSSGCHMMAFGVESGSDSILKIIDKGITRKQTTEAFKCARKSGIETLIAMMMVGLPGETENDIKKTADLVRELDADITKVSVTIPYPGTRLYEKYKNEGMLLKDFSWSSYRMHNPERIYRHENLEWSAIKKGYYDILKSVYFNPRHYTCRFKKITGVYAPRLLRNYRYALGHRL
jgi:radical SAM superfamily enzyme YgiQ (UPF0313 family)